MSAVHHYTVGSRLGAILASGELRPSSVDLEAGERPVLWFSSNRNWEETATKLLFNPKAREVYRPTLQELHGLLGLFRFTLPEDDDRLLRWPAIHRAALMSDTMVRTLVRNGRMAGARPEEWSGSLQAIPLRDLTFEVLAPQHGGWLPARIDAHAAHRSQSTAHIRHTTASSILAGRLS